MELIELLQALLGYLTDAIGTQQILDLSDAGVRTVLMIIIGASIFFADDISKFVKRFGKKKTEDDKEEENDDTKSKKSVADTSIQETKNLLQEHHNMSRDMLMRFHVRLDRIEDKVETVENELKKEIEELKKHISTHLPSKFDVYSVLMQNKTDLNKSSNKGD